MKRFALVLAMAGIVITFSSCYLSPVVPPTGAIYTNIAAPQGLAPRALGSRKGSAGAVSILGLFSFGDSSVSAAATDGGVQKINHTDYEFFNFLGIYQKYTTVVHGD